jgi:hypothetical protein
MAAPAGRDPGGPSSSLRFDRGRHADRLFAACAHRLASRKRRGDHRGGDDEDRADEDATW